MLSKPTIKYIQSLQHKKFRDEHGVFVAEGPKVVNELLSSDQFPCVAIYATKSWVDMHQHQLSDFNVPLIQVIEDFELEKIAAYASPNQVVAIFKQRRAQLDFDVQENITLVLEDIQDPGNFGTIIRSADWFGVRNIVCSHKTVDQYNGKVVQSTMASLGRVNVLYTDIHPWLMAHRNVRIIATTLNGNAPQAYHGTNEAILLMGNEANGLSAESIDLSDDSVTIPKMGAAESLNVGVATAIMLYALRS
jgi:TrmH family RNA methyltransferase